jgi:hypothetical protein
MPTQRIKRSVRGRNYENYSEVWQRIDFCNKISKSCWPSKVEEIAVPVVEVLVVTVIENYDGQLASNDLWQA